MTWGLAVGMVVLGFASGLLPVVNAEAALVASVLAAGSPWVVLVASLALGQSAAKVVIYSGSRAMTTRMSSRGETPILKRIMHPAWQLAQRHEAKVDRLRATLQQPGPGTGLVAFSALFGIPPLALSSILAGAARFPLPAFCGACLVGHLLRFALIAYPASRLVR